MDMLVWLVDKAFTFVICIVMWFVFALVTSWVLEGFLVPELYAKAEANGADYFMYIEIISGVILTYLVYRVAKR